MADPDLPAELLVLLQEFSRSGLRELHIRKGDFELYLSTDAAAAAPRAPVRAVPAAVRPAAPPAAPVKSAALAVATAPTDIPPEASVLRAPNLGTFYRAPKPGAPSYVEVGSIVAEGDELCLIEVMKLFTAVRATHPGRVHAVLVEDGAMVEADQPLFAIVAVA